MMKVGIVGGGAMGLLFTSYFTKAGYDVTLFVRRIEQRDLLLNQGLTLFAEEEEVLLPKSMLITDSLQDIDLLIITVKQHHLGNLMPLLKSVKPDTTLMFIQNGMAHLQSLDQLQSANILLAVVEHGATKLSDCSVAHKGYGQIKVGVYKGSAYRLKELNLGKLFNLTLQDDWQTMLVEKLLINHAINPLTAIYGVTNGTLLTNPFFKENMYMLFNEAIDVLEQSAIKDRVWDKILAVCHRTKDNRSSMLQDVDNGRLTEIDAISGYILSKATKGKKRCPLTRFVVNSVKGLQGEEVFVHG